MYNNQGLPFIKDCIGTLQMALDFFAQRIGRPEFIEEANIKKFRYREQSAQTFQVIKCVRVVSGFNACLCLLNEGYVQEGLALIRTIYEFLNDIDFIQQGIYNGNMSKEQQNMLKLFFEDDFTDVKLLLNKHAKNPTIPRKKVYAEVAKGLSPDNPDRIQRIVRIIEEIYSGYIHGAYPHVMELYEGGTWRFSTKGMSGTPRHLDLLKALVLSLHDALNLFAELSASFGNSQLFTKLKEKREELESSILYRKFK
jgi:hypothetical protein